MAASTGYCMAVPAKERRKSKVAKQRRKVEQYAATAAEYLLQHQQDVDGLRAHCQQLGPALSLQQEDYFEEASRRVGNCRDQLWVYQQALQGVPGPLGRTAGAVENCRPYLPQRRVTVEAFPQQPQLTFDRRSQQHPAAAALLGSVLAARSTAGILQALWNRRRRGQPGRRSTAGILQASWNRRSSQPGRRSTAGLLQA